MRRYINRTPPLTWGFRSDRAARRATRALPSRVSGPVEMFFAFRASHRSVFKLTPKHLRNALRDATRCPATTLSVAAWTPADGLTVGIAGDTRVVVMWRDDTGWHGRPVGRLHRSDGDTGYLTRYLGVPRRWPHMGATDRDPMDIFTDDDVNAPTDLDAFALLVASDGAWEPIAAHIKRPIGTDAQTNAERIMQAARRLGLEDNATVAVAHVDAVTDSGDEPGE